MGKLSFTMRPQEKLGFFLNWKTRPDSTPGIAWPDGPVPTGDKTLDTTAQTGPSQPEWGCWG
jgi:hypothetical protein